MRPAAHALTAFLAFLLIAPLALAGGCEAASSDGDGATAHPSLPNDQAAADSGVSGGSSDTASWPGGVDVGPSWEAADASSSDVYGGSWGGADWGSGAAADAGSAPGGGPGNVGPGGECLPNCDGKQCGPDGCGGTCGWCSGDGSCQAGACVEVPGCAPACAGEMIGVDDGCGGV
jgi:hypothetical protein